MISGTICLGDQAITFEAQKDHSVRYIISDCVSGVQETKEVPGKEFMIALGIALSWDGELPGQNGYELAETVQPDNAELRFIP